MARFRELPVEDAYAWPAAIVELHRLMLRAPKPVIAAVDGPAYAGGMGLAGMCDIVLATTRSTFAMPEAKIGMFPMIIIAHLARSVPRKALLEMMLTGEPIDATEAHRLGFVNHTYADRAELDIALDDYAARFTRISPHAVRLGRRAFTLLADLPAGQALDAAPFLNLPFFLGTDLAEGAEAFFERRPPSWQANTDGSHSVNGEAYLVGAVRTPVGRRGGGLSGVHPADLGAIVVEELLARTNVRGEHVDDVIFGCVSQVGAQASNIARTVALSAGLPESVPGFTLDRQCGSSQQAVHLAAQAVVSGAQDLVVAGGVEVMSLVPIASPTTVGEEAGLGHPRHGAAVPRAIRRPGDHPVPRRRADRRALGPVAGGGWSSTRWRAIVGRWPRSRRACSTPRSWRWVTSARTRVRGRTRLSSAWRRWRRCGPGVD